LQKLGASLPLIVIGLAAFNVTVVMQEFARGVAARRAAAARRNETESVPVALIRLLDKNRRRYGGYIVHLGIVCMYLGFVGAAWTINREATLLPGGSATAGDYTLTYRGSRMEVDDGKRMVFADVDVQRAGQDLGRMSPAKFIYKRMPESPTTEVALRRGMRDDLYVVVGTVDPQSKRATFQFHVNPLVSWIWVGMLVLILGASVSLWPEVKLKEVSVWGYARAAVGATTVIMLSLLVAAAPAQGMLTRSARPPPGRDVPSAAAGTESAPATAEPAAGATEVHGR
jgi:cytochrome c-type biogenesis protein CcmF